MRTFLCMLVCVLALAVPARAQVNLNLQDADLGELIKLMSAATGKTFVPGSNVASVKVTVISPGSVSVAEAYRIFEAVLRQNGYTTVEEDGIVRIVPLTDVKSEGTPTFIDQAPGATRAGFVTQVVFPRFASAEELANLVRSLVSPNGFVAADPSSNALILTDTADNVRRILRILGSLDVEGSRRQVEVFFLRNASAETLARSLTSILEQAAGARPDMATMNARVAAGVPGMGGSGAAAAKPTIVPDARTNALLVAGTAEQIGLVASLVARLDIPATIERATLHVYRLQHANAKDLADILTAQVQAAGRQPADAPREREPEPERQPDAVQQEGADVRPRRVVGQFESAVTVTADPATNSLVISALPEDYRILERVIAQLDERRTEVYVEALILEATTGAASRLGVELRFPLDPNESGLQPIGGTTFPVGQDPSVIGTVTGTPLTPPAGFVAGVVKGTISIGGQEFLNIAGLARALAADSAFNVLSTPGTATLDNQEAEIIVGEERPFIRSQQSTDVGTLVSTFDFRDIGIKLRFTPHISVGGTVRLDLYVEITNFVAEAQGTVGAVTTTKRSVSTSILVDSGQMAVIGGLMQNQRERAEARVPCLGALPLVGSLFRSSAADDRKTNLLIFIEPRILPDRESLERLRQQKSEQFDGARPEERTVGDDLRDILRHLEGKPPE